MRYWMGDNNQRAAFRSETEKLTSQTKPSEVFNSCFAICFFILKRVKNIQVCSLIPGPGSRRGKAAWLHNELIFHVSHKYVIINFTDKR